jgi:hypothetical protein
MKEIAATLQLSTRTAETHKYQMMRALVWTAPPRCPVRHPARARRPQLGLMAPSHVSSYFPELRPRYIFGPLPVSSEFCPTVQYLHNRH